VFKCEQCRWLLMSLTLLVVSLSTVKFRLFKSSTKQNVNRVAQSVSRFDPRQRQRIFPPASVFRSVLGPTQSPVQWVPGVLSPGLKRGRGVTLTTHPHLVPRSRISRSYKPLPPSASMACSGTALALAATSFSLLLVLT
jgi:hypothetical protein